MDLPGAKHVVQQEGHYLGTVVNCMRAQAIDAEVGRNELVVDS